MSRVGDLYVGIGLDSKQFKQGLDDLYQSLKLSKQQFKTATAQMGDFGKLSDKLKTKAKSLAEQIDTQKSIVKKLNDAFLKSKEIKGEDAKKTQALELKLLKAKEAQGKLENELKKTNTELYKQTGFSDKLKDKLKTLTTHIGNAALGFGKLTLKAGAFAAVGIGTALGKVAKESITRFAEFETGMNEVFTLLPNISGKSMEKMETQVKSFSEEFGRLPTEVVPALYQALSASIPEDNVFNFLEISQKAAKGGVTSLETAVDSISSVVNAYGNDVIDATKASDLMFTAVRLGKTTFSEMAGQLSDVTPIASSVGVGFGEITAAIATMTSKGVATAEATTQIKNALSELSDAGSIADKQFREISGVSFPDFVKQGGTMQQAFDMLSEKADSLGLPVSNMFGSLRAGQAVLSLTGKNAEDFAKNIDAMNESAGATEAAFQKMDRGLKPAWDRIKASFATAALDIGDELAPSLESMAEMFIGVLPTIKDTVVSAFGTIGTVLEELQPAFETLATEALPPILDAFSMLATTLLPPLGELIASFSTDILPLLIEFLTVFIETILPAIMPVLDVLIKQVLPPLLNVLTMLVQTVLPPLLELLMPLITEILPPLAELFGVLAEIILPILAVVFENLREPIEFFISALADLIEFIKCVFTGDWEGAWEHIQSFFGNILDGFKASWKATWESFLTIMKNPINAIIGGLNKMIGGLNSIKITIPDWVPELGGSTLGFNIPVIPKLAAGTDWFKGGITMVGELGREIVELPRGSKVYPHAQTEDMLSSNAPTIIVNVKAGTVVGKNGMNELADMVSRNISMNLGRKVGGMY